MSTSTKKLRTNVLKTKNDLMLNILLSESVITPQSCSTLVTGLIKYIIHQKEIIPYPFERLNYYVSKRKDLGCNMDKINSNGILTCAVSERYFKQTMDAADTISSFLESIDSEILMPQKQLSDVILLLGSTPRNPKQVFHIRLPKLTRGHVDSHHSTRGPLLSVMKKILIDDSFNKALSEKLPGSTNLYVLLKSARPPRSDLDYIQWEDFHLSPRCQRVGFRFHTSVEISPCACVIPYEDSIYNNSNISSESNNCSSRDNSSCENIFNKNKPNENLGKNAEDISSDMINLSSEFDLDNTKFDTDFPDSEQNMWYQNKLTLKSFKDVKVKGSSVVYYWVNPEKFC